MACDQKGILVIRAGQAWRVA